MLRLSQHTSTMHDFQTQRLSRPIPYSGLSRLRFWWVFSSRMNFPKTIVRMGSGGTRYFYLCTFFEHLSLSLSFSLSLYLSLSLSISTTSTSSHVSCLSLSACTPAEPPPDGSLTMDLTISLSMGRERKSRRRRASDTDAIGTPDPSPKHLVVNCSSRPSLCQWVASEQVGAAGVGTNGVFTTSLHFF